MSSDRNSCDDQAFDPAWDMLLLMGYGHTYCTQLKPGIKAHKTRESLDYALRLLWQTDAASHERASRIIRAVLRVQDVAPTSPTYGLWPWYAEEPVTQMDPPDYNWAEFCGALLAEILICHADHLPGDLAIEMKRALHRACLCMFRRNVGAGYTNISLLGGAAMAAAGELLGDEVWLAYGRQRLADLLVFSQRFEGFTEFNSPTYTMVVVHACEFALRTIRDLECRKTIETLLRLAWEQIAENFHAPTGQWAGAQSRSYHDFLAPHLARELADRTGATIQCVDGQAFSPDALHRGVDCPAAFREQFQLHGAQSSTARRLVNRAVKLLDGVDVITTTWMDGDRTLGTASAFNTGNQVRHLHGYWLVGQAVAQCRMRMLKDGRDFCPGWLWNAQKAGHVLTAVSFCDDMGDWNGYVDRPAGDVHRIADLRLRIEVLGPGATAEVDADGFVLRCGLQHLVIRPAACVFDGRPVSWVLGGEMDHVWVDAVLHTGNQFDFHIATQQEPLVAVGCAMVKAGEAVPGGAPRTETVGSDRRVWTWEAAGLSLTAARQSIGFRRIW